MARLLLTGFGPFPAMPRNPSEAVVRRLASTPRWRLLGVDIRAQVLTTAYRALHLELAPALAERPDAVLMVGVAGRSKAVRVEWRATSRRSTLFPDVEGHRASAPERPGPGVLRTPVPASKALLALRRHAVPSRLSRDAGRYLCNAAYHDALATRIPTLFIHIPKSQDRVRPGPRMRSRLSGEARLQAALTEIGLLLIREANRQPARLLQNRDMWPARSSSLAGISRV